MRTHVLDHLPALDLPALTTVWSTCFRVSPPGTRRGPRPRLPP